MATRPVLTGHSTESFGDPGDLSGRPLLVPIAPTDPAYARAKRATDVLLSAAALIVLAPIFLLIALAILLTSGRPIIYRQTRLGLGGHPFTLYKFRTMVKNADAQKSQLMNFNEVNGPVFKMSSDPRVTPVGRFLRKTSLDETPQFLNTIKGEMSIVGPRPLPLDEALNGGTAAIRRLSVTPGITGLWQVSGRDDPSFDTWLSLDMQYLQHRSVRMDIRIILKTIPAILSTRGAR